MGVFGSERAGATGISQFFSFFVCVSPRKLGGPGFGKNFNRNQLKSVRKNPGEGNVRLQGFKWGFLGLNEPAQQELADFSHFSCVLAHEYFGDLASGKIFTETNWRPSVSTRGRGTSGYSDLNGGFPV